MSRKNIDMIAWHLTRRPCYHLVLLVVLFFSIGVEAVDRILASVRPRAALHSSLTLPQASFPADARWMTSYLNGLPAPYQVQVDNSGASATDRANENQPWYFTSSAVFSGDMSDAYNGILSFRIMHVQVADSNAVMITSHPIVMLKATCGYSLTWTPKSFPTTDVVTPAQDSENINNRPEASSCLLLYLRGLTFSSSDILVAQAELGSL
eukprot:751286-Hanusia_phi.AAC.3